MPGLPQCFPSPNDTCDIYRAGRSPPAAPDVAGVPIYVIPRFTNIKGSYGTLFTYSHIIYFPLSADIRDDYDAATGAGSSSDWFYVPDQNGIPFNIQLVTRRRVAGGGDFKEVLCTRMGIPSYPTNEG
jgi:hypothetical protein